MNMEKPSTKSCKHCTTEIPKGAKVCPQCGKKQSGVLKWVIIGIAACVVIGAAAGNSKPKKVGNADTNTNNSSVAASSATVQESADKEAIFKKGEIAELNGVQVTLTDYRESTGEEFVKPAEGNVFLLAEFEIVNNTEKELTVSSMMSFKAYADDYALNYSVSAMTQKEGNQAQLDGAVAAGKKMKGWIGWEVPNAYKNVEIHFTDNVWSNSKFLFLIEK